MMVIKEKGSNQTELFIYEMNLREKDPSWTKRNGMPTLIGMQKFTKGFKIPK